MNFTEIAETRQSCRNYDPARPVEREKLDAILASARLAPSACNGQPYYISVCRGEAAAKVAKAVQGMGMNKFASDAPILLVISEKPYVRSAAVGAKLKKNDYRSIDIGILSAYITAEAAAQGSAPVSSAGWTTRLSVRSVPSTNPSGWSSRWATPPPKTSSAPKSANPPKNSWDSWNKRI